MRLKRYLLPTALMAAIALAIVVAPDASAQFGLDEAAGDKIPHTKDIALIIGRILQTLLGFVGTLFLLLMVYAGFLYMTARGESAKVDSAKQLITGAIIGIIIIASAYAITSFVLDAATGTPTADSSAPSDEPVVVGALCYEDADCGGGGLICEGETGTDPGTCALNYGSCPNGGACTSDADCSTNGTCVPGDFCVCSAI